MDFFLKKKKEWVYKCSQKVPNIVLSGTVGIGNNKLIYNAINK